MKRIYSVLLSIGLIAVLAGGCKKNETETVLHSPGSISGFTTSAAQVVLSSSNDSATVVKLNWQAPNYGYSAVTTYTLLIDQPSDTSGTSAWGSAIKVTLPSGTVSQSWLGTDFNHIMNQLGLAFGTASPIVIRLKADVNQSTGAASTVPTLTTDLAMTVTPYRVVLIYPKLYVAGDFLTPNWTQIDQPGWVLASVKSDGTYEGYVNFSNGGNNFKLCTQLSWNGTNYGWGSSATTMSSTGGNLYSAGPHYSRVVADVNQLTINYVPTNWTVAGDFNSWSVSANPMTFNPSTNVWTVSGVSMTAGTGFKFVGDPNWNTNYGVDSKGNMAINGGNIPVAKSGTFTITLDLSHGAGNYTYTVK